jgi:hypothetical protein
MFKLFSVFVITSLVIGATPFASATPIAPRAPLAAVDFPAVDFGTLASVNLAPRATARLTRRVPKAPKLDLISRAMLAPLHCGPMHDNAIGGRNADCTQDL